MIMNEIDTSKSNYLGGMNNAIIDPTIESFDFSKITLGHPNAIQGNAYFTKILYDDKPLYIQTPKSTTRQGFEKMEKK